MNVFGINLPKINLPKIDIGSIGKEVLSKGVDLLKTVAKDAFAPASDGKGGIFNKELDIKAGPLSIRLKNPIDVLSEKLLGVVSSKAKEFGFDTGAIGNMLNGVGGGSVDLPALPERIAEFLPAMPEIGGATSIASGSGVDVSSAAMGDLSSSVNGMDKDIAAGISKIKSQGDNVNQGDLMALQQKMQRRNELYQMLSNIMQMEHDMKKGIINNLRS